MSLKNEKTLSEIFLEKAKELDPKSKLEDLEIITKHLRKV